LASEERRARAETARQPGEEFLQHFGETLHREESEKLPKQKGTDRDTVM
jgi:hypothetical protein